MSEPKSEPLLPPTGPDNEPTDANPVPLSPTDPRRRTAAGDAAPANDVAWPGTPLVPVAGAQPGGQGALPAAIPIPKVAGDEVDQERAAEAPRRPDSEGAL